MLGRSIREGRIVSMLIHRVASINIESGELKCDFMSEFVEEFRSPPIGNSARTGTLSGISGPMSPGTVRLRGTDGRTQRNTTVIILIFMNLMTSNDIYEKK